MRAVIAAEVGPPLVLRVVADLPAPRRGPGEVLVEVHAAGVNPIDTKLRSGEIPWPLRKLPKVGGRGAGRLPPQASPYALRALPTQALG